MLLGPLRRWAQLRLGLLVAGALCMPMLLLLGEAPPADLLVMSGVVLCVAGELAERTLFFRAVVPLKMPGGITA